MTFVTVTYGDNVLMDLLKQTIFVSLFVLALPIVVFGQTIVANHTVIDEFDQIPQQYIEQAKTNFRIAYGHTSHGSQVVSGMSMLQSSIGAPYSYTSGSTCSSSVFLCDGQPSGDLGNPDRTSWATRTRSLLNASGNNRNVIIWSWCGQASSATESQIANDYLANMAQLEAEYPNTTFVYMTGHLDGTGEQGNLNLRNEQIRAFVRAGSNRVLFDFADIESYNPDGAYFLDKQANDECYYYDSQGTRQNWATQWCAANPQECPSCGSCAHSQCINCLMKGKAFWWMMARLAGWTGSTDSSVKPRAPDSLRLE